MKIAVIDDEEEWQKKIVMSIENNCTDTDKRVDIFSSGAQYLKSKIAYDVAFVDVEMEGLDGFETIKKSKENNHNCIYIILTTHTELSRKGYMVDAYRYIDKIKMDEEMSEAFESMEKLFCKNEKICINIIGEGKQEIMLKNIIYIETEKHSIIIHTKYGDKKSNESMQKMEDRLCGKNFFRCHNSYIVNLDEVMMYKGRIIYLKNGDNLDVSRRKLQEFKIRYIHRQCECANA